MTSEQLKPCSCGKPAEIVRDGNVFRGQTYSDRYPPKVANQNHGFMVQCMARCLMTCWWHYESEAIEMWNTRAEQSREIDACKLLLESLLAKGAFWEAFEHAKMNPDDYNIQKAWESFIAKHRSAT